MTPVCALALCVVAVAPVGTAQDAKPQVWKGVVKDVRGTEGRLFAAPLDDQKAKPKEFDILQARFIDADGAEIKVGDLRPGDQVEVSFAADGKMVQQVKLVKRAIPPAP
jgi:hypothetical protein